MTPDPRYDPRIAARGRNYDPFARPPHARPMTPDELRANLRAAWSELNQAQANLDRAVPRDCPFMDPRRAPTLAPCVNRRADK